MCGCECEEARTTQRSLASFPRAEDDRPLQSLSGAYADVFDEGLPRLNAVVLTQRFPGPVFQWSPTLVEPLP